MLSKVGVVRSRDNFLVAYEMSDLFNPNQKNCKKKNIFYSNSVFVMFFNC